MQFFLHFQNPNPESGLDSMMNAHVTELTDNDLLFVQGEDSGKFLQGQLTCDIDKLTDDNFSYGAICNTKGRVICTFIITRAAGNTDLFLLVMAKGMGERIIQHLGKYIVFYKARMYLSGNDIRHFGLTGTAVQNLLENLKLPMPASPFQQTSLGGMQLLRLPDSDRDEPRIEIFVHNNNLETIEQITREAEPVSESRWLASGLVNGFFLVSPRHAEEFTPEELNLDLLGAVSFTKGCYTGQEIVARMHYRGKLKKRLYYFTGRAGKLPGEPASGGFVLTGENLNDFRDNPVMLLLNNGIIAGLFSANTEKGLQYCYLRYNDEWHTNIVVSQPRHT